MAARNWAALAADIARFNHGIRRARLAYAERLVELETTRRDRTNPVCACGNPTYDGRYKCDPCRAETAAANRERKKAQQKAKRAALREARQ